MTLTKKQQDEILKARYMPRGLPTIIRLLTPVARLIFRLGFVRRSVERTAAARIGQISRCRERGDHEKAVDLAIDTLRALRHRKPGRFVDDKHGHFMWWMIMQSAAVSLPKVDDPEKWNTVIAMARAGVEPFEGFEVAYAFLVFARRKLAERDHDTAVEFATLSSDADESWPEPDIWLGWYQLEIGGGDAFAHLKRAVDKDQSALFRIADDPAFRNHPDLIERLKETSKYGLIH